MALAYRVRREAPCRKVFIQLKGESVFNLESLETRRMLSVALSHGVLTVTGTDSNDKIVVGLEHGRPGLIRVEDNGNVKDVRSKDVQEVRINGKNGNDVLKLNAKNGALSAAVRIDGGSGKDTLVGGSGNDTLKGGAGNDTIIDRNGNDSVDGGSGHNTFKVHDQAEVKDSHSGDVFD